LGRAGLFILLTQLGSAQPGYVQRELNTTCEKAQTAARTYLKTRGFTEPQCGNCPNSLKTPKDLLDSKGKGVGTIRIRRELSRVKVPFWLWSSPLHAAVFISAKPLTDGCRLAMLINFYSLHSMVVGFIPVGESLGLPSNGRLETEYLDAIAATFQARVGGTPDAGSVR
jgi:hypothetical protein